MQTKPHKEVIGNATLYLGDCLEILPTLEKVDAVITDPPYNASFNEDGTRKRGVVCKHKGYAALSEEWDNTVGVNVVTSMDCETLAFCSFHTLPAYLAVKKPHQILHWVKTNPFPALGDYYSFSVEYILWWRNGGAFKRGGKTDTFSFPICGGHEREKHPTQKPLGLMEKLIGSHSMDDSIIADPFMGSGTTGVACMNLGRKFIGIEIEPKYFEIACERIAQAQKQIRMFP